MNRTGKYVIILAGGSGERFWPLSSAERPKQFVKIFGGKSLIRQAMERVRPLVPISNILVVTAKSLAKMTMEELPEVPRGNILLEPCRRNTAPAIASALGEIRRRSGEDALAAVVTADHLMSRPAAFRRMLQSAFRKAAEKRAIVTLGVRPTFPSTGFGYINKKDRVFVEKPDAVTAARYVRSGKYVWNAGMFIFRAATLQAICARVAPELADLAERVRNSRNAATAMARAYPGIASISSDYAVMEKIRDIEVVSGDFGWDDVGSYGAVANHLSADRCGNVTLGKVRKLDCSRCVLLGEGVRVSAFGVSDLVVATCGQEVLVMSRKCAADLKRLLALR